MANSEPLRGIEPDNRQHSVFIWTCLLAFTEPVLFSYIGEIHVVYSLLKTVCSLSILLYSMIIYFRRLRLMSSLVVYCLFWCCFLIPPLATGNGIMESARTIYNMVAIGLLFSIELSLRPRLFLRRIQCLFFVYVISSFTLALLVPQGFGLYISGYDVMEDSTLNLLGLDNALIYPILILLVSTYSCHALSIDYVLNRCFKPIAISCVCLLYEVYVWSGTGLIAVLFAVVMMALAERNHLVERAFRRRFSSLLVAYSLIVIGLLLFNSYVSLADFFQEYLNKSSSLFGRATLWTTAIDMIIESPIYGYGLGTQVLSSNFLMYSPHNLVLQTLLYGGFIAFALLVLQLGFFAHSIASLAKNTALGRCATFVSVGLISFLIVGLTEACLINTTLVFLLSMGWFAPKALKDGECVVSH